MKTAVEDFVHELESLILIGDLTSLRSKFRDIANKALEREKEQLKEMYLKGIENYDPTFKRKSQWTPVSKKEQKQHIVDIMKADEEDGLYNENK